RLCWNFSALSRMGFGLSMRSPLTMFELLRAVSVFFSASTLAHRVQRLTGSYSGYIRSGPMVARGRFELPSMGLFLVRESKAHHWPGHCFSTLASPLHHRATRDPGLRLSPNKPSAAI